jgi:hypothetical protein
LLKVQAKGCEYFRLARPCDRATKTDVENPHTQKILRGDFVPGNVIVVDVSRGVGVSQGQIDGGVMLRPHALNR